MKKLIATFLLLSFLGLNAQTTDYQYVLVPNQFSDFKENQYQLNVYLKQMLRKSNFQILGERIESWPEAVRINPCLALTADVKKTKHLMRNGVELIFTDCKKNQVYHESAVSHEKEFEKGYQEALKTAYSKINFGQTIQVVRTQNEVVEEILPAKEVASQETAPTKTAGSPTVFSYKNKQFIQIGEGKGFSLIDSETGLYYARFILSSIPNVYHVILFDESGTNKRADTLGYYDGKTLKIEQPSSDHQWSVMEFELTH